jgi:hypothetical protein
MPEHRTVRGRLMEFNRPNASGDSFPWNEVIQDVREIMVYGIRFKVVSTSRRCVYQLFYANSSGDELCQYDDKGIVMVEALNITQAVEFMEPHMLFFAKYKLLKLNWEKS